MQTLSLPPQRFAAHDANAVTYCNFKVYHIRDAQRERETDRQTDRQNERKERAWGVASALRALFGSSSA